MNDSTVMNTWYEKNDIYKCTWQHPCSKMWYCIDYVLMKQSQNFLSVICSADCWTDHKLLHEKIILWHKSLVAQQHVRHCFAGYKLRDPNVDVTFDEEVVRRVSIVMICLLKRCGVLFVMDLWLVLRWCLVRTVANARLV